MLNLSILSTCLFLLAWLAVFTSQTLIDVVDTFIVVTAFVSLYKKNSLKNLFLLFKSYKIWLIWMLIIFLGLLLNGQLANINALKIWLEYKWIISFLSAIYLWKQCQHELFVKKYFPFVIGFIIASSLFSYWWHPSVRAGGVLNNVMAFSQNIGPTTVLMTLLCLFLWNIVSRQVKYVLLLLVISCMSLTVLTVTRGVWLSVFTSLFVVTFFWKRKAALQTLLLCVFLGFSIFLFWPEAQNRFLTNTYSDTSGSDGKRVALLRANWHMFTDNPFLGVGVGLNKEKLSEYFQKLGYPSDQFQSHAHNQYLEYLATTGLLGLCVFFVFLYYLLKPALQQIKIETDPFKKYLMISLFGAILSFLLAGLTECNLNIANNRFFFVVLSSWLYALATSEDKLKA